MLVLGGVALYGMATAVIVALSRAGSESRRWQVEKPTLLVVR